MAQPANFKSPSRMGALGEDAPLSSTGSVSGGKSREEGLKGVDFERRSFLGKVVGGVGAAVAVSTLYPIVKYIIPPVKESTDVNELVVGKASEVPENSGKIFQFNKDKVLVINDNGALTACSAVCTHLGCLVRWEDKDNEIFCPCHGAKYTQTGEIISGPQPLPLAPFNVRIEGEDLIIAKA
ncbi:QcrA and Rieske domain-containing protein [Chlorobium phaeovibrioides]|uniref:Rieske 2Fe-2S domain-containing protein n=1 Tax=Chlorobium phaeovibrioides TaxID=1094 RepID=A0A5M8ICH0_CHLPH|nr:Rieske (2Fe-2S) protein [Chlorobium phaeovibrioides]KAA6233108.1 Rieske 2Fe-2S domain-containing protein [Chlorobium phaeovibrioides]MWV53702.1 Rieske 2Fe-2S domain-containing protein [Chlorobium phaeovibrioides]QEQ56502.1 Rieske 2Fe-2S domain-containing protein [Chlorobium phaeovibrioides]